MTSKMKVIARENLDNGILGKVVFAFMQDNRKVEIIK